MLKKISEAIAASGKIALLPHIAADGDALGSSLALALAVSAMGREVTVLLEEDIPYIYRIIPGVKYAELYTGRLRHYDLVLAIDCGDMERMGARREIFKDALLTGNIDHHPTNTEFAFYNYVDEKASATAEIIYKLIGMLGVGLDISIATCLYIGIATDTGGFRYSNTTPLTHDIASQLLKQGVDVAEISQKIFDSNSLERVKMIGEAIKTIELFDNGKIAIMAVSNEAIRRNGAKEEDCDGIINVARSIRGVEIAAMLKQWENGEVRVNLRSNSEFDVSAVASLYKGGGHKKAAGYITQGSLEEVKTRLLEDIREAI